MRKARVHWILLFALVSALAAQPARADSEMAMAWELLHKGQRGEANALATRVFSKAESKREKGEALLVEALCMPDGEGAMVRLQRFVSEYRGHPLEWRAEMELGLHSYALGTYAQASRHFTRAIDLKAPRREEVKARYWLGLARMGSGDFTQSRRELESVKADDAGTGLSDAASLAVADCLRQEGDYTSALSEYTRLTSRSAGSDWLPAALHGAGLCFEKLKRETEARQAFSRLAREFPSSFEATAVRNKLKSPAPAGAQKATASGYTIQAGAFSQEANARKLVATLTEKGITGLSVVKEERGGRILFIVYLGEFPTKESAQQKSKELSARLGLSCSVAAR